jgi:prepilin-type N-terminal cleavage/methylation domain-containing protein
MQNLSYQRNKKWSGFTLVEILVVISIIGIIAAAALASMSDSRMLAKHAAVIEQARQMMFVAELSFNDTGDYLDVNRGYLEGCDEFDTGDYTEENQRMCQKIIDNGGQVFSGAVTDVAPGCCATNPIPTQHSIMVRLPGTLNEYFCIGSSGSVVRKIIGTNPDGAGEGSWVDDVYDDWSHPKGCPFNP